MSDEQTMGLLLLARCWIGWGVYPVVTPLNEHAVRWRDDVTAFRLSNPEHMNIRCFNLTRSKVAHMHAFKLLKSNVCRHYVREVSSRNNPSSMKSGRTGDDK